MAKGEGRTGAGGPETAAAAREARLKAALKANMARRKAQARARQEAWLPPDDANDPDPARDGGEDGQQ